MIYVMVFFSAFITPFSRTFIIKGNANNEKNPPSCPFLALMAPFLVTAFISEQ